MKTLLLDVETSPNLADVWSLWNINVSLSQLRKSSEMICWAAKWYGSSKVEFRSKFHDTRDVMLKRIHELMSEADALVHYNGNAFDIPTLNKEFLLAKMGPPAPSKQIDLYRVVRSKFRFPSNKLQYVSEALEIGQKVKHEGHTLWVKCEAGDPAAWRKMKRYNIQDVNLLEDAYNELLPWIDNHPNVGFFGGEGCPNCGSGVARKQGFAYLSTGTYQRWQCTPCGTWYRGKQRIDTVETIGVKL